MFQVTRSTLADNISDISECVRMRARGVWGDGSSIARETYRTMGKQGSIPRGATAKVLSAEVQYFSFKKAWKPQLFHDVIPLNLEMTAV